MVRFEYLFKWNHLRCFIKTSLVTSETWQGLPTWCLFIRRGHKEKGLGMTGLSSDHVGFYTFIKKHLCKIFIRKETITLSWLLHIVLNYNPWVDGTFHYWESFARINFQSSLIIFFHLWKYDFFFFFYGNFFFLCLFL